MPTKCPECGHPVKDGATACPNCPASWENEGEDGYKPKRRGSLSNIPLPVIWLSILAILGLFFWKGMNGFIDTVDGEGSWFDTAVKNNIKELDPKVARAVVGGPADGTYGANASFKTSSSSGSGLPTAVVDDSDQTKWHLRGKVVDLVTLEAVPDAEIVFYDAKKGMRLVTRSAQDGTYFTSVPPLGDRGYQALVNAKGYAGGYLNPEADNVPDMTQSERQATAADVAAAGETYTVQGTGPEDVQTVFYLAPLKK